MTVVVDASVAVRWFTREHVDKNDTDTATEILWGIYEGRARMIEPPHFLCEVASVLVRKQPKLAYRSLDRLVRINWKTAESMRIYSLAMDLSARLNHHLFDTLYHATSLLTEHATFVTADERYYAKARGQGGIVRLADFALPLVPGDAPLH